MTWNAPGDVDLHTFEPNGAHVFYKQLVGSSGVLDVDNVIGFGPEHYYASCERSQLQVGVYQVGINHFDNAAIANVQVSSAKEGVLFSTSLPVGPERGANGNASPIPIVDIEVIEDDDGVLSLSVQ